MVLQALVYTLPVLLVIAAISDLATMKIPNAISIALVAGYCAAAYFAQIGWEAFLYGIACGLAVLAATFGMFAMGWMGGGDAKLASATAVWMGWTLIMPYLLIAAVFGGLLTLMILFFRWIKLPESAANRAWIQRLHRPRGGIPYGIALAAAGLYFAQNTSIWLKAIAA